MLPQPPPPPLLLLLLLLPMPVWRLLSHWQHENTA